MAYLNYDGNIKLANGYQRKYGDNWNSGFLGVGQANQGYDVVGAYQNFDSSSKKTTTWTITPVVTSGNGTYVWSGDQVNLQNASDGSYLGLYEKFREEDNTYPVASYSKLSTDNVAFGWTVLKYTPDGSNSDPRLSDSDVIYLVATPANNNKNGSLAGVLDTNGYGSKLGFLYLVSGTRLLNRGPGTGMWQVTSL
ncbi:hypothetical protein [Burkholderia ubonensis]|uniref:hypothetical protein n=1 Tax=Burkholderia ubonensis TaxID=101571 RepID=UPI000AA4CAD4|nr:hypothetical protein [Burkholderia ubonensis]